MSVSILFLGNYNKLSLTGIMSDSDRMAAVKAVLDAAGGTINMRSFARGPYDSVLDNSVPSQEMMMGAMATVRASRLINDAIYIELMDGDPIWEDARSIAAAYKPANA